MEKFIEIIGLILSECQRNSKDPIVKEAIPDIFRCARDSMLTCDQLLRMSEGDVLYIGLENGKRFAIRRLKDDETA